MVISLISSKGGVGKSTLALCVANEWMARGQNVLLVDADEQGTCRVAAMAARESNRLAPYVIAGDVRMAKMIDRHVPAYDHVVIDTPGRSGDIMRAALLCSDVALIPVGQTGPDAWALKATAAAAAEVRKTNKRLRAGIILTKHVGRSALAAHSREALMAAGLPIFKASTSHRVAWQEAITLGQGVAQYAPNSPAAEELRAVVAELGRFAR